MTRDPDPAVAFHRTDEGHLAAHLDGHAMIAFAARDGRLSVWSAFNIDRSPEQWVRGDFFIAGTSVADEDEFRAHATEYAVHIWERKALPRVSIRSGHSTPWGMADDSRRYADGVVFHSSPSHGGFELSAEANTKVHPAWRNADRFYEEDIDWAKVAHAFPGLFTAYERKEADLTLRNWEPDAYEEVHGLVLQPGQSRRKDEKRVQVEHTNRWVVISAMTLRGTPRMLECLASLGGQREATQYKCFLVPADEYKPGPFGFVIDESRHAASDRADRLRPEG